MVWIKDVSGFEYILFHPGNTEKDTDGCVLVGEGNTGFTITNSVAAYTAFYAKVSAALNRGEVCWLSVVDMDR